MHERVYSFSRQMANFVCKTEIVEINPHEHEAHRVVLHQPNSEYGWEVYKFSLKQMQHFVKMAFLIGSKSEVNQPMASALAKGRYQRP